MLGKQLGTDPSQGLEVRKWYACVEEIRHEGGPPADRPLVKAAAAAVVRNPFAGSYAADLSALVDASDVLGSALGERVVDLLGGEPVEGYGKGGIVGVGGEQEHAVACITTVFGDAFRAAVGGGVAWISSTTKVAPAGQPIDVPLAYKDALYVRSHYDTVSVTIPDAPRPDEIAVVVVASSGGRVHHRVGGLARADALGDGLR